jgi:tRNA-specific 2-thiouridylase
MSDNVTALGLVSGGLDSLLSVRLIKSQGVDVIGVNYEIGFSQEIVRKEVDPGIPVTDQVGERAEIISKLVGLPVRGIDLSDEYLKILFLPRHGYGANINPCVDCRIFMLKKAGDMMRELEADFIFTGEVLGQRPMSQRRDTMNVVERDSGLRGLLVRPLSAKLLKPTIPEEEGWIDREEMLDLAGRSRKRQLELARQWGVKGFKQPAGGCLLTDVNYARRVRDYFKYLQPECVEHRDMVLLTVGRHLRLSRNVKIVVGRDSGENLYIRREWWGHWILDTVDLPGPTVLIQGEAEGSDIEKAAAITARYSDGKDLPAVEIRAAKSSTRRTYKVKPVPDEEIRELHI